MGFPLASPRCSGGFIRSIPGCADVQFARHGYAVEYDCHDPRHLGPTLESKPVQGPSSQDRLMGLQGMRKRPLRGLWPGINAALRSQNRPPLILSRAESYIGVMIDDLISVGATEPYRMFTSRAEFRLSLREDNADLRLRHYGRGLGIIPDAEYARFESRRDGIKHFSGCSKKPS